MRSLDIAGTGMQAQQTNVEVISNNIANLTTTGFKRRRAEFQDLIYQDLRRVGSNSSDSGSHGTGGRAGRPRRQDRGNLPDQTSRATSSRPANSLDLAIRGNGYFQVTLPSGDTAYTRDGTLSACHRAATIVTADGLCRAARHHGAAATPPPSPSMARARCRRRSVGPDCALDRGHRSSSPTFPNDGGPRRTGRQPVPGRVRPAGNAVTGTPASPGFGTRAAGLHRRHQTSTSSQRDHRPDHRPARLRDEQQGDHRPATRCSPHSPTCAEAQP